MFQIDVTNQQEQHPIDASRLKTAVRHILDDAPFSSAVISLAIVDDPTIHDLNRRFLDHDYATDVLSFVLESTDERLEGEVIVSADTAARLAGAWHWSPADELLLYVIHGTLHLVGYDDTTPETRQEMRAREDDYLARSGVTRRSQPSPEEARS